MAKPKRAGKVKDKWREKRWVTVLASPSYERSPIAYIPITGDKQAIGRVIETTLFDITKQDPQQNMLIKLHFQITSVEGNLARTLLKGHEYSREYLRSLVRRGASMVNFIRDYRTRDNAIVRVYVVAFTVGRINSSRKHEIRLVIDRIISIKAANLVYEQFTQESVNQNLARELYENCKNIAKIRHLGVRKVKLIQPSEGMKVPLVEATTELSEEELDVEEERKLEKPSEQMPEIAS